LSRPLIRQTKLRALSTAVSKRWPLEILKIKQRDRRTHSANSVLQTNKDRLPQLGPNSEVLPDINQRERAQDSPKRPPRRSSPDIVFHPRDRAGVPSPASSQITDEDCPSSPGSLNLPRPGTLSNGVVTLQRASISDLASTEPFIHPHSVILSVIGRLNTNARKKEMDWISQAEALNEARRLVYHHPLEVRKQKRDFVMTFVPAIQQLRSTTAKSAISLCQEVFESLGEHLEHEIEDVTPVLLKKAGETSNAGETLSVGWISLQSGHKGGTHSWRLRQTRH